MEQRPITPAQARNRGAAARDRYEFSLRVQHPAARVVAAGLVDEWQDGYNVRSREMKSPGFRW
jgi:hypothetical protein